MSQTPHEPDAGQPPQQPYGYGQTPGPGAPQQPYGYGQTPGPSYADKPPLSPSDERLWSLLAHLLGMVTGFLAPLVIWLVFRDRSAFVNENGKEALNFQITLIIANIVAGVLTIILIGFVLLPIVVIVGWVFAILASIAANRGQVYRYPVTLRLVS